MMLDKTPIFDQLAREFIERQALEERSVLHSVSVNTSFGKVVHSNSPTQVEVTNGRVTA